MSRLVVSAPNLDLSTLVTPAVGLTAWRQRALPARPAEWGA
ncbi:MAG TPA: hypothetical protein VNA27_09950 [Rubrobacteraceae bacterium]|nr:hypothetical protein [Rubrobacteraceae bacterium]